MRSFTSALTASTLALILLGSTALAAEKTYQVTGKVLELTDKTIVVQKDEEKWEIQRTTDLKVEGDLKVGAKVTIKYHMVGDSVEVKK